jgi:hypothetical protein
LEKIALFCRLLELARTLLLYQGPLGPTPTKGTVQLVSGPAHRPFLFVRS